MPRHELQRDQWKPYFDRLSQLLGDQRVEIATESMSVHTIATEWVTLHGVLYHPNDDALEIAAGDMDHVIEHPKSISVDEVDSALCSVDVVDAEGNHQIVQLRQPMAMPAT